jgi:hypothetical protein
MTTTTQDQPVEIKTRIAKLEAVAKLLYDGCGRLFRLQGPTIVSDYMDRPGPIYAPSDSCIVAGDLVDFGSIQKPRLYQVEKLAKFSGVLAPDNPETSAKQVRVVAHFGMNLIQSFEPIKIPGDIVGVVLFKAFFVGAVRLRLPLFRGRTSRYRVHADNYRLTKSTGLCGPETHFRKINSLPLVLLSIPARGYK